MTMGGIPIRKVKSAILRTKRHVEGPFWVPCQVQSYRPCMAAKCL